jgi:hypothetical protein
MRKESEIIKPPFQLVNATLSFPFIFEGINFNLIMVKRSILIRFCQCEPFHASQFAMTFYQLIQPSLG